MDELSSARQAERYQTYLVTCWQERDAVLETAVWRFSLETSRSGQRCIFSTLEEMISTIKTELQGKDGE